MDELSQFLQLLYRFGKREVSLYVKAGNLLVTLHSFSLLIVKKKGFLKRVSITVLPYEGGSGI